MNSILHKKFDEIQKFDKISKLNNRKFIFDILNYGKIIVKESIIDYQRKESSFIDFNEEKDLILFLLKLRDELRFSGLISEKKQINIITSANVIDRYISNSNIFKEAAYFDMYPKDAGFAQNFIFENICITAFDEFYTDYDSKETEFLLKPNTLIVLPENLKSFKEFDILNPNFDTSKIITINITKNHVQNNQSR